MLVRVTTTYFCAGIIVESGKIVESAPIMRWAIGKTPEELKAYYTRRQVLTNWELLEDKHDQIHS